MIFNLHDFKLGVLLENGIILLAGEHFRMTYLWSTEGGMFCLR